MKKPQQKFTMSTSGQTYKALAIPFFKESFDCIDEVMKGLGFPYYLIGVSAIAQRVLRVLEGNLQDAARSAIAKEWARKLGSDLTSAHALLRAFQQGIMP
jgi:hypothetical protein